MHGLALGVRHAGIFTTGNATTPPVTKRLPLPHWAGDGKSAPKTRPRSCRMFGGPSLLQHTYIHGGLDSFLGVVAHLYGLSLWLFFYARLVQPGGLAWRYRCAVSLCFCAFSSAVVYSQRWLAIVLHQPFSRSTCWQLKQRDEIGGVQ